MTRCAAFCVRGPGWSTGRSARAGVDDEPEPQHVLATPQPCSQFIQLEMRELEVAERVLVQRLGMFPSASEKGS
jgi:hypothetical protein